MFWPSGFLLLGVFWVSVDALPYFGGFCIGFGRKDLCSCEHGLLPRVVLSAWHIWSHATVLVLWL